MNIYSTKQFWKVMGGGFALVWGGFGFILLNGYLTSSIRITDPPLPEAPIRHWYLLIYFIVGILIYGGFRLTRQTLAGPVMILLSVGTSLILIANNYQTLPPAGAHEMAAGGKFFLAGLVANCLAIGASVLMLRYREPAPLKRLYGPILS